MTDPDFTGRVAWVTQLPRWENPEKQKDAITWFGPVLVSDRLGVAGTNSVALSQALRGQRSTLIELRLRLLRELGVPMGDSDELI